MVPKQNSTSKIAPKLKKRSQYFNEEPKSKKNKLSNLPPEKCSHKIIDDPSMKNRLNADFFEQYSTIGLAKNLLGKVLCRQIDGVRLKGMIVETEAYLGTEDHASYTFGGRRTEGNEPMYMAAGTCFVRFTYGMYYCFNISSNDFAGAVLIRAAEPLEGLEKMIELRKNHPKAPKAVDFTTKTHQLANGPSKLCIAFNIDRLVNKLDITSDKSIWIENAKDNIIINECDIVESKRIGISPKNLWSSKLLRYYLKDNKSVSKW